MNIAFGLIYLVTQVCYRGSLVSVVKMFPRRPTILANIFTRPFGHQTHLKDIPNVFMTQPLCWSVIVLTKMASAPGT